MHPATQTVTIEGLRHVATSAIPDDVRVWLYGSRARGDARSDSDWDILIIAAKDKRENDDFELYSVPFIDYGFDCGQVVMPHFYTESQWREFAHTPFATNVERDKIALN